MPLIRRVGLLAALLALYGAAPVRAPTPLYTGVAPGWGGALARAFANPTLVATLRPGIAALDVAAPEGLRSIAPLVAGLEKLDHTPASFAALKPVERDAAVQLAADDARDQLVQKLYELGESARAFSYRENLDRDARAELYGVVARLGELRDHYRGYLDDEELAFVEGAYASAAGKAWSVRQDLLREAIAEVRDGAPAPVARTTPPPIPYLRKPSAAAVALREDMGNTKSGWGQEDLRTLYLGYGFEEREGGKHRFYSHPVFPQLHDSVSRQNDLPPGYAHSALKLLDELDALSAPPAAAETLTAPHDGPPAGLSLADLSVLLSPPSRKASAAKETTAPRAAKATRPAADRAPPSSRRERRQLAALKPAEPTAAVTERAPPPEPGRETGSAGWALWLKRLKSLWPSGGR